MRNDIQLKTGVLNIPHDKKLDNLISFGSRINKKRGFFFVSKVIGKHLPVKPSVMKETYQKLAKMIDYSNKTTLFIGFAEAATALGQGVFESHNQKNSFYIHSTRFNTSKTKWFSFQEEHSHAPSHIFYKPIDNKIKILSQDIKRIILIDDEITTGKTANNMITELKKIFPLVDEYLLLTILDWSQKEYKNFKSFSLYKDSFIFNKNNNFKNEENILSEPKNIKNLDEVIPYNFSRYGIQKLKLNFDEYIDFNKLYNKKILLLGTSEFMYPPYLLAQYLEDKGIDIYFQSTTRSPISIDGDITSKLVFMDNYFEEIDNFLYNVVDRNYDKIFVCYETTCLPKKFDLINQLKNKFDVEEIFFEI
jgi:hypothetical protein